MESPDWLSTFSTALLAGTCSSGPSNCRYSIENLKMSPELQMLSRVSRLSSHMQIIGHEQASAFRRILRPILGSQDISGYRRA